MFHVKICGVRTRQDIDAAGASGADAIGLNFFPPSVRYLDLADPATKQLSEAARQAGLYRVGVFVNETLPFVRSIAETVGLDAVQLHGDETLDDFGQLQLPRLRAIKLSVGPISIESIDAAARPWIDAGFHPLLDVDAGAAYGGSGRALDWPSIAAWSAANSGVAWTLAGGLTPENVTEAMRVSGASSVDTASGVESPRGEKSAKLIELFVSATGRRRR